MADVLLDDVIEAFFQLRSASTRTPTVGPRRQTPPILVCRGPHPGRCALLERNGVYGVVGDDHGLVVEADLDIFEHREGLRGLRSSLPEGTTLAVVHRITHPSATAC